MIGLLFSPVLAQSGDSGNSGADSSIQAVAPNSSQSDSPNQATNSAQAQITAPISAQNQNDNTPTQQLLQVDKRFTYALALLNDKFLPKGDKQDRIIFVSLKNKYYLYCKNNIIYDINDKDFFSLYKALRFAANYLLKLPQTGATKVEVSDFNDLPLNPYDLIKVAKDANKTAANNNNSLKKLIESLLLLNFLADDKLDDMSVLQANTWMLLAVYEAKTKVQNDAFIAMLTHDLHYERLAKHASERLATSNPLRQYYQDNNVETSDASNLSKLIFLKKQIESGHTTEWLNQVNSINQQPIAISYLLNQLIDLDIDKVRSKLIYLYPLIVISEYNHNSDEVRSKLFIDNQLNTQIENILPLSELLAKQIDYAPTLLLEKFTAQIKQQQLLTEPGLLDKDIFINYWQAKIFDSYYSMATYLLTIEKDTNLANGLLKVLQDNKSCEVGSVLANWYDGLLNARNDRYALLQFDNINQYSDKYLADKKEELQNNGTFKSPYVLNDLRLLVDLYDYAYRYYPNLDAKQSKAYQQIVSQLDTRYSNRTLYYRLKSQYDPKSVDAEIDLSKYNIIVNPDLISALANAKDEKKIAQAYNSTTNQYNRMYLLRVMSKRGMLNSNYLDDFDKIYQQSPESFTVLAQYIGTLLQGNYTKQVGKAKYVLENWLHQPRDLSHYQYLNLISLLAKTKLANGDLKGSLAVISPILKYDYEDATLITISVVLANKDADKAAKMIADYKQKYGDTLAILGDEVQYALLIKNNKLAINIVKYWRYRLTDDQINTYVYPVVENMLPDKEQQAFFSEINKR